MAEPTSNPAQLDPNLAELDPYVRRMKAAGGEEILTGLARIGRGERAPPPSDYTAERTRLIAMLGQLTELETASRSEEAKTLRAQFALQNTLLSTLGKIEVANLGAQGQVLSARIGYFEERAKQLNNEVLRYGPREMADLGEAPRTSIGGLGQYIKDRGIKPGAEAAFAREVQDTVAQLKADPRLVDVYRAEIQKQYGVDIGEWFAGKQGDAALAPVANSLLPVLQQGEEAQIKAEEVLVKAQEELALNAKQIAETPGVNPGSALARSVNSYVKGLGLDLGAVGASGLPAKPGEAPATGAAAPAGTTTGTAESSTGGLRPYLNEQRDLIIKELDRLENAGDPESVRLRQKIMGSPALAQWAAENGYANYRPDQQFKAAMAYRRKALKEQDAAFNAQLESDILKGEAGTALGRTGVKIKQFLTGERAERDRLVEEGLIEAKRRRDERAKAGQGETATPGTAAPPAPGTTSAEVVGGSQSPQDKAPGTTEAAPTEKPTPPSFKEDPSAAIDAALVEEPTFTPFEEGAPTEARGRAIPALARGRNEIQVGAYVSQATGVDPTIAQAYKDAQAYKKSDPVKYMTTLQELADKIRGTKLTGQAFTPGRSFKDGEGEATNYESVGGTEPKVETPILPPEPEAAPEEPSGAMPEEEPETQPVEIEEPPEGGGTGVGDALDTNEMSAGDSAFLAQLDKASAGAAGTPSPAGAPLPSNVPQPPKAGMGAMAKAPGQKTEAAKPIMFESFGAEAATTAAGDAQALYQRMLDEETRKRRAGMLRGSMTA